MQTIILIVLVGLAGGIAIGLQSPMASMISQRLGVLESVFIVHLGGALSALVPLLLYGGGRMGGLEEHALVCAWSRSLRFGSDWRNKDKDLTIIWSNRMLSAMLNLQYYPVGRKCREVYSCECQDSQHCSVLQALSTGKKVCHEIQLVTKKGERKYIKNITTPIRDEENNVIHLFKLSLDSTQQEEKVRRLSLLRNLAELMQGALQIPVAVFDPDLCNCWHCAGI